MTGPVSLLIVCAFFFVLFVTAGGALLARVRIAFIAVRERVSPEKKARKQSTSHVFVACDFLQHEAMHAEGLSLTSCREGLRLQCKTHSFPPVCDL